MHRTLAALLPLLVACSEPTTPTSAPPPGPARDPLTRQQQLATELKQAEAASDLTTALRLREEQRALSPVPHVVDGNLAKLLKRLPAEERLAQAARLASAHKDSVPLCGVHGELLAEGRRYLEAAAEYERCQALAANNFDKSLFFGVHAATMKAYAKQATTTKRRKGRSP